MTGYLNQKLDRNMKYVFKQYINLNGINSGLFNFSSSELIYV